MLGWGVDGTLLPVAPLSVLGLGRLTCPLYFSFLVCQMGLILATVSQDMRA